MATRTTRAIFDFLVFPRHGAGIINLSWTCFCEHFLYARIHISQDWINTIRSFRVLFVCVLKVFYRDYFYLWSYSICTLTSTSTRVTRCAGFCFLPMPSSLDLRPAESLPTDPLEAASWIALPWQILIHSYSTHTMHPGILPLAFLFFT